MSVESEDQWAPASMVESQVQSQKQSKISYKRDFLLSFRDLDACKKLPAGFDTSFLSEFKDASYNIPERQRIHGGLYLQRFGSTPLNRVDNSSNYSRGSHGRWDTRSSGSNERDGDSSSDLDSVTQDSGRRCGNHSRHTWKHPEHDGLLGNGAFPRPSGYTGGASAPVVWRNDHYQINRSSEPYHPPHFHKAPSYSRQDNTDSRNDETFGSDEWSSEDRAEEERKRRASFELMRRDQQKALREKQKPTGKHKQLDSDIALLEKSETEKNFWSQSDGRLVDQCPVASVSQGDPVKCYFPPQAPSSRLLVPPGFSSSTSEKHLGAKSSVPFPEPEVGNTGFEDNVHTKSNLSGGDQEIGNQIASFTSPGQMCETNSAGVSFVDADERTLISSSNAEASNCSFSFENPSFKSSSLLGAREGPANGAITNSDAEKVTGFKDGTVSRDQSSSILEKLFNNALPVNIVGSPSFVKHIDVKSDGDEWGNQSCQASKFAHWFLEEEKKPVDDVSSSKTRDLLSLIVSNNKGGSEVSAVSDENVENMPISFPLENTKFAQFITSSPEISTTVGTIDPFSHHEKSDAFAGILTCEDLEQSILAEVKDSGSHVQHSMEETWNFMDAELELQKSDVDDHASQHLLSLLQKGKISEGSIITSSVNMGSSDKHSVRDSVNGIAENVHKTGKALTLETLFGSAFMKELHSVEAPVSVHKDSTCGDARTDVSEPQGLPFSFMGDGFFHSTVNEHASNKTKFIQVPQPDKTQGHCLSFNDIRSRGSKIEADGNLEGKYDGTLDIQLPEEESLITVSDPLHYETSQLPVSSTARTRDFISSEPPTEIVDELAALNVILKDEKFMVTDLEQPSFLCNPYEQLEPEFPYQHLHVRRPEFPHQINNARPPLHSLNQHAVRNHQIKFIGPEGIHHDMQHALQPNIHRPFNGLGGRRFDPAHHSAFHHMPIPGNFRPPHMLHGFPRSVASPHPFNHMLEMNPIQGFLLNHQQAKYSGLGVGLTDVGGGNHPEVLDRLIEMELLGNQKKTTIAAGHGLGIYGPELDMTFRYR